jgi:glycerol-3-phosphate dehydrogenase
MQPRDPSRLESDHFDVLVVGGGIHGLATAYEAASRGLRTALIDAADFGSGISFNHQKTVHGGLRSLQSLRLDRAREGIRERRALARIAPWFLRPMPFIMGTYRSMTRGRAALRAAFALDGLLGRDRNEGVERELHLPPPKLLSRALTMKLFAGIKPHGLTGGAQWHDYQMVENDRLTLAFAAAADRAGCVLANYAEAVSAIRDNGRIAGMTVRDVEGGRSFAVRAALTINAAGSRTAEVMSMFGVPSNVPLLAAMNLITARPAKEIALASPTSSGRMLTLVPWRGRAIVGTSQSSAPASPADVRAASAEVDAFIADANDAFPALGVTRADVTLLHRGLVPAAQVGRTLQLLAVPSIRNHAADGANGAMTITGVKYTTARGVAQRTVDAAARHLGKRVRRSETSRTVLPGAGIGDHEALAIETARRHRIELSPATLQRLSTLYAERSADIIRLVDGRRELARPLAAGSDAIAAEIVHVIQQEMAVRLTDIVIRRTTLGAAGHPGAAVLSECARIARDEMHWTDERMAAEIATVEQVYELP